MITNLGTIIEFDYANCFLILLFNLQLATYNLQTTKKVLCTNHLKTAEYRKILKVMIKKNLRQKFLSWLSLKINFIDKKIFFCFFTLHMNFARNDLRFNKVV